MSAPRLSEADVDVAAHRDSYPMGNIHHGTDETPYWGTFCVECKQSWPCDVSILGRVLADRDAAIKAVRALLDTAELRAAQSLNRTFFGDAFPAFVSAADLRALLPRDDAASGVA